MLCVKVTYSTKAVCIFSMDEFANFVDEVRDGQVGEKWKVELVEMDEEEYVNLPEFNGP